MPEVSIPKEPHSQPEIKTVDRSHYLELYHEILQRCRDKNAHDLYADKEFSKYFMLNRQLNPDTPIGKYNFFSYRDDDTRRRIDARIFSEGVLPQHKELHNLPDNTQVQAYIFQWESIGSPSAALFTDTFLLFSPQKQTYVYTVYKWNAPPIDQQKQNMLINRAKDIGITIPTPRGEERMFMDNNQVRMFTDTLRLDFPAN